MNQKNPNRRKFIKTTGIFSGMSLFANTSMPWLLSGCKPDTTVKKSWRSYEVYTPEIQNQFVVNPEESDLLYNHCTAVAWFRDRWFYLWNANALPREGDPDQTIFLSTSQDGLHWSEAVPVFIPEENNIPPIPTKGGKQWQPAVGVVEDEFWVLWSLSDSTPDYQGLYFSRLKDPEGKWENRRLVWGKDIRDIPGGEGWRIFPTQNIYRLRNGRILVPVNLMGGRSADAPENFTGFFGTEKLNSVLYTDDLGETWHVSPGSTLPGASYSGWEPTVWEQSDGSVMMLARNNIHPRLLDGEGPPPHETITMAISHDSGETWSDHEFVPIDSTVSRMHVVPQDGRGVWNPVGPDDDLKGRRYFMVHNDVSFIAWNEARINVALFFKRGDGFEFTAGPGLTGSEEIVKYPQMWVKDDALYVSYSEGPSRSSTVKLVRVSPLPDPDTWYLLPRNNIPPASDTEEACAEVVKRTENNKELLTFTGASSAGVELDENHRSAGDAVELKMRFRIEDLETIAILTIGDAVETTRVVSRPSGNTSMEILITGPDSEHIIGSIPRNTWTALEIHTQSNNTRARLNNGTWSEVSNNPKGTWVYLGEGYPGSSPSTKGKFSVEVSSVRTRII